MRNNLVNKLVFVVIGITIILCITFLIQTLSFKEIELVKPIEYDASQINIYETIDGDDNQIYQVSENKVLDLSRPIITTEQTQVYKNRTNTESFVCTYAPNVVINILQVYEDGWVSLELFDEIVYMKTDTLANVPSEEDEQQETKPTEPVKVEELPEEILGGKIGEYDEDGYLIVQEEVKTDGDVHARSGPSTKNKIMKSLRMGERLTRIGVGPDGWSRVYIKGEIMYITSYYLSPTAAPKYTEVNEQVIVNRDAYVRYSGSILSKKIGYVDEGQEVTRVGIGDNGWSQIMYKDQIGYVWSLYLELPETPQVTTPIETVPENTEVIEITE
ncbi:MAG: hypothetical protein IJ419_13755 [Agathobacter sp.]|nr:hypothetical protein [Agathobacter sp.]